MPKILLVDDSQTERAMVSSVLQEQGFEMDVAFNGRQGLEKIESSRPDLIILDILMPEMDGYTMLRELHKKEISIPVILLTKQKEKYMKDLLYFENYSYYLEKPFKPQELVDRIKEILK